MRDRLLILWLALLGASRVDFLAGSGPFVLTPFLVLSPVVVVVELLEVARSGWRLRLPDGTASYLLTVSALVGVLLASTFASYELGVSARRFALLAVHVYLVFLVALALANRPAPGQLLFRGAVWGLGVSVLFDIGQAVTWFRESWWPEALGRVVGLEPSVYYGVVPRLTGASHDPNLGGLLLVFQLALLALLGRASRRRAALMAVGATCLVLTLSRSALLAGGVLWGATWLEGRELRVSPVAPAVLATAIAGLTALVLLAPATLDPLTQGWDVISQRFTLQEGSASEHALLAARGWEVGTGGVKQALLGIGYGNAYVTVQDVFPGNDHGNFHSLFVTLFAEAGVGGALLALGLFYQALVRAGDYRPLIAALLAFNVFQQAHNEAFLWLGLMLAWLKIGAPPASDTEGA